MKRYDYVKALSDSCNMDLYDHSKWQRILRKLVREALNHPDAMKRGKEVADRIAKELIP